MKHRWIPLVLTAALFLTAFAGCADSGTGIIRPDSGDGTYSVQTDEMAGIGISDGRFTIQYDPDESLNPLEGTSSYNMTAATLMYEGLYRLDGQLQPIPVLCESCKTKDGLVYEIKIKSGILMHDNSALTASDVVYSLMVARDTEKFGARFEHVGSIEALDDVTLRIVLTQKNYNFAALLDVPVIRSGDLGAKIPVGSGPYYHSAGYLLAFEQYRDYKSLPIDTIRLEQIDDDDIVESFGDQHLDLLHTDPTGTNHVNIAINHNTKNYDTTVLQYVGFNMKNAVLEEKEVRQAISLLVDRDDITNRIMSGYVTSAPLVINSKWYLYDESWNSSIYYPNKDAAELLKSAGLKDMNRDGILEYEDAGNRIPLQLVFIVNNENSYKVAAAQSITDALNEAGLNVTLKKLSWNDYLYTIAVGEFDLYYGEVRLTADFDLTELLSPTGGLNYGSITSGEYANLVEDFLSAKDTEAMQKAGKKLCRIVSEDVPILPILYKEYAVYTYNNVVSGMVPSQTGVFCNISEWTMRLRSPEDDQ